MSERKVFSRLQQFQTFCLSLLVILHLWVIGDRLLNASSQTVDLLLGGTNLAIEAKDASLYSRDVFGIGQKVVKHGVSAR